MRTISINTPGPQGPVGPQGVPGATGSAGSSAPFNNVSANTWATTSSLQVTGSLGVTGNVRLASSRVLAIPDQINALQLNTGATGFSGNLILINGTNGAGYVGIDGQGAWGFEDGALLLNANTSNRSIVLATQGVERMRVRSTGNVGIGISTPSASLHISGSSNSGLLEIDSPAVNNILYVSGSGNVGIGTNSPTSTLDVNGTARVNGYALFGTGNSGTPLASLADFRGTGDNDFIQVARATAATDRYARFYANGRIDVLTMSTLAEGGFNFGRALIATTSGPRFLTQFYDTFAPTSGTGTYSTLQLVTTINQTGGANGITRGLYINPTLTSAADFRAIETTSGSILFNHGATSLMFISSSGNVGIGILNPASTLDVNRVGAGTIANFRSNGSSVVSIDSSGWVTTNWLDAVVYLATADIRMRTAAGLTLSSNAGSSLGKLFANGNFSIGTTTDTGAKLNVRGSGATNATTALRVENSNTSASLVVLDNGFVGINTGSAAFNLDVNGSGRFVTNDWRINNAANTRTIVVSGTNLDMAFSHGIVSSGGGFSTGNITMGSLATGLANTIIKGFNNCQIDLNGDNMFLHSRPGTASPLRILAGSASSTSKGTVYVSDYANLATAVSSSAILQVDSTVQGFLPPRMTNAQRTAISTPAVGLMVYCTDATEGLYIYKSTGWTFIV